MENPFRITLYDKAFNKRGTIGNPLSVSVTPRHNAVGSAEVALAADHQRIGDIATPGARCVIHYRGTQIISGRIDSRKGEGPARQGVITFTVEDDLRLLYSVLGWPVPNVGLGNQLKPYDGRVGPIETLVKAYVTANATTRLGLPITCAPDQGRGPTVKLQLRMHPLADKLLPPLDAAGMGVRIAQQGAGLVLDVYVPTTYPRTLSEAAGTITDWTWSEAAPNATRVVAGLQGEGASRTFYSKVDVARETTWGDKLEVFRDARDIADEPETADARMQESLDDGAPTAGLGVTLAETGAFAYDPSGLRGVRVGDVVRLAVGPDVVIEDVLREATLTWNASDGLVVRPVIGERSDDPDVVLVRAISRLARGFRNLLSGS